jgi:hypothetical protein
VAVSSQKKFFDSSVDSIEFLRGHTLAVMQVKAGTQFPLSLGVGVEFAFNRHISAHLLVGPILKPYMRMIIQRYARDNDAHKSKMEFIAQNFSGGISWNCGMTAHYKKYYLGGIVQFHSLSINSTPQLLVENLAPERAEEILDRAENSHRIVENFYKTSQIKPAAYLTQMGVQAGRRFLFRSNPRFSIATHLSYSFTIASYGKVDSRKGLISSFLNDLVGPVVSERLSERLQHLRIPSVTFAACYSIGRPISDF